MVRDLLVELAEDVPDYTDADRAVLRYRRGRRRRLIAVPAVALTLVALVAAGLVWWPTTGPRPDTVAVDPPALTDYPAEIPTSGAPGPLAGRVESGLLLAYQRACPSRVGCQPEVAVGRDGRQYDLSSASRLVSLSPDGRWLISLAGDAFELRDLASGAVRDLPPELSNADGWEPMAWSPDGRYLLLNNGPDYRRLDLRSGRSIDYQAPLNSEVLALLPGGDVLTGPEEATLPVTLTRYDPATGRRRGRVTVAAGPLVPGQHLSNGEPSPALVDPTGRHVALNVVDQAGHGSLLDVDLAGGGAARAVPLPGDGTAPVAAAAYLNGGLLLVRPGADPAVELLDPATGGVRPLTRVPGAVGLLARGAHGWVSLVGR